MLNVPYIKQPDPMSCALACYAMVAKHFFPKVTFEEIAKVSDWQPGYIAWGFKFQIWIADRGIKIEEHDPTDYEAWASNGLEGLRKTASAKELRYYTEHTKDIEIYSADIAKLLKHPNFTHMRQKPAFELLEKNIKEGNVCEVVLNSRTLRGKEGFSLHRVVVLDTNEREVVFHDPAHEPHEKAKKELFEKAWLKEVNDSELCVYKRL